MTSDEYIKERVDDQISWYDKKSMFHKKGFYSLRVIEIVLAVSIPFLMGYISDNTPGLKLFVGVLGVTVGIISGLLGLFQFQEHWISYRTTCEALKHEKNLFLSKTIPYNGNDAFNLFVNNVESMISRENSSWNQLEKKKKKEDG